jgi:regulator of sigma E protease
VKKYQSSLKDSDNTVKVMRKNLVVDLKDPVLPDESSLKLSGKLEAMDKILKIDGKRVRVYTDMSYQIGRLGIEPISVTVSRGGKETVVENVVFPMISDKNVLFGESDFKVFLKEKTVSNVLHEAFFKSTATLKMTISSVTDTFTGRYGVEALSGPIGIGEQVGQMAKSKFPISNLLTLMVLVSLSLGVCNLLPLPVLDGGRVLLFIIEAIRRKPLNPKVESAIMAISMGFVLLLMVLVAFKDIWSLF